MKLAYSVARFVPSLVRGEAINIGVALEGPDPGHVLIKFTGSLSRARQIFPDADTATVGVLRKHFRHVVEDDVTSEPVMAYATAGQVTLGDLVAECRNTMLQFSDPTVTIAEDVNVELDDLYQTFVAPRVASAAKFFGSIQMAPARLRLRLFNRLDQAGLIGPRKLQPQFRVAGTVFPWEFDLGQANGRVNIVQSIALDATDDLAVNRALLLTARIDDIREAHKHRVEHVVAAADRLDSQSPAAKLLDHHGIEVTQVNDPTLPKMLGAFLLEAHGTVRSRGRAELH